jgi:hypothetical protein
MLGKLLLQYRAKKTQKRYAQLSYEIRPRLQATAWAELINPEWVKQSYSVAKARELILKVRLSDPAKLVRDLAKVLDLIENRSEEIPPRYKVVEQPRTVNLDRWLQDHQNREISPYVVTKELKRLVPAVSKAIADCALSREDLYEYYQLNTLAYMEDAVEFLEAILSLKLTK